MNHYLVPENGNDAQIALQAAMRQYERPNLLKALWQLTNTFIPYIILCALMYLSYKADFPYWITSSRSFSSPA